MSRELSRETNASGTVIAKYPDSSSGAERQ